VLRRDDSANDAFLFQQGPTKGLGKIQFHDYHLAYNSLDLPNGALFRDQIELFKAFLIKASPDQEQTKDIDYLLALGEILTLVAYGQLIIESKAFGDVQNELLDEIFDFMVRDFSKYALNLFMKPSNNDRQREMALKIIKAPVANPGRFEKIWEEQVYALKGQYKMKDQD
jgi:acyl-CoA dehydrogenase